MTKELFREDGYLKACEAQVVGVNENRIILDQTVCYPLGGGQPGDQGVMRWGQGLQARIVDTRKSEDGSEIEHLLEAEFLPPVGENVNVILDWQRRYGLMRLHSCMHMICAVVPAAVTGNSIREDGTARIDFDLPEPPNKLEIQEKLNALTTADHPMTIRWISDEEMQAQPELVRTMSVQPPMGQGRVRLVEFAAADLQPCGGTHVANTQEIGPVTIRKIEKKGKQNRRIVFALATSG